MFAATKTRYVLVNNKRIPLGVYLNGVKKAIENPDAEFDHGLTCWWPCTGAEIRRQFMESVLDRINAGIPYIEREKP
ncbi:MAG: hypothetical protein A2X99_02295 [Deltaproteobacteria bacterium GWB2_55_19]|nr:MAG: hypothetical protein A2X99_02295 [Deltaproteobacteria bacterium GWB2_55_19]